MNMIRTAVATSILGLSIASSSFAESQSPNFESGTSVLSLPVVSIDSTDWFSNVDLELNFATGTFSLLSAEPASGEVLLETRVAALEDLISPTLTEEEETSIEARLLVLEENITSPISVEGASLANRIQALESVLSPEIVTTNLKPGRYTDISDWCFDLTGPYVYSDTRSTYFLQSCTTSTTGVMEITSGPTDGHPQMGDRLAELSLPDNRVYGLVTNREGRVGAPSYYWFADYIVGLRQSGDILTLDLYTSSSVGDVDVAEQTITLTKQEEE